MQKRKRVDLLLMTVTADGYGGRTEVPVSQSHFYALVEGTVVNLSPVVQGVVSLHQSWLMTTYMIADTGSAILQVDGQLYKIKETIRNRRRWYYRIEVLS